MYLLSLDVDTIASSVDWLDFAIASSVDWLDYSTLLFNCPYCRKFLFKLPSMIWIYVIIAWLIKLLEVLISFRNFHTLPVCFFLNPARREEPMLEKAWPHLQIVYEFFLRFVTWFLSKSEQMDNVDPLRSCMFFLGHGLRQFLKKATINSRCLVDIGQCRSTGPEELKPEALGSCPKCPSLRKGCPIHCKATSNKKDTLPETDMASENGWLEDDPFLSGQTAYFQVRTVSFGAGHVRKFAGRTNLWI